MQPIDINQTLFSLSLAGELAFGIVFAVIVHWASRKHWVGQTAWAVVVGTTVTLLILIPAFGLNLIAMLFGAFACSGVPMILEYLTRIQSEIQKDNEEAKNLASEFLNDRQTGPR